MLLFAACGSTGSGGAGTASSTGASSSTTTPQGKVPQGIAGQTLTIQFTSPVSLNPALEGTAESDVVFGALDYDSLIHQLPSGRYVGDLATSWSYKSGSSNKVFDLTLRSGAHFSDGSAVTPAAVVASLDYFKSANGPQAAYLAAMTSAKPTGPDSLQLTFATPEPDLPFLLSQYQDIGQIIGPKGLADPKSLTVSSDGAGPYELSQSQTVANSTYTFVQNPHYWDPQAVHYHKVVVKVINDPQSALSAVESGQVDVATGVPGVILKSAKAAGLTTYSAPFSIASLILMDRGGAISPLGKLPVRQAINDAIDRKGLAQGLGTTGSVPTDEVAIPGTTGYDPALASKYTYDVAKAKKLMASAGEAKGFTLNVLDCVALDPNGDLGAALKTELAAIGITVNLTEEPTPAQFIPASLTKKYAAVIWPISQNGEGFPYSVQFGLAPFTNVWNTSSPQLQALMTTAGSAPQSAQAADYQKVNDYLVDHAWYAPVFSLQSVYLVGKNVTNIAAPTDLNTTIDPVGMSPATSWYPAGA